jgi:hypothetical protein
MKLGTANLIAALSVSAHAAVAVNKRIDNGLGITPALGWNSWVSITESLSSN